MDADFVYAIVPRQPLRTTLGVRAREIAKGRLEPIAKSMALEEQGFTKDQLKRQIDELAQELEKKPKETMALIGDVAEGETPLSEEDLRSLKLPLIKTREDLTAVEGPNILSGKLWALDSPMSRSSRMLTVEYLETLHQKMLGDVWGWAGALRTTDLGNAFASSAANIRPDLLCLYHDAIDYWLVDERMDPDEFALRVHHRVVKIHPFQNGNGRHSRLLADLILDKHFKRSPFTWGGNALLGNTDPNRPAYIAALRSADRNDYEPLKKLCRATVVARLPEPGPAPLGGITPHGGLRRP